MGWFSDRARDTVLGFSALPAGWRHTWAVFLFGIFAVCTVTVFGTLTFDVLEKYKTATPEAIEEAKRKVELERLRVEQIYVGIDVDRRKNAEHLKLAADVEAYRSGLGLKNSSAPESLAGLAALANLLTEHLLSILAVMCAAALLPTFSRTGEPERLVLNIAAGIILTGAFALATSAVSPTAAAVRVDVFSLSFSSSSVAVSLVLFGTALAGAVVYGRKSRDGTKSSRK